MDAADDAKEYKDAQALELKREKVRKENKLRKAQGEKPLKLPAKPKIVVGRRRRNSYESDDEDADNIFVPDDSRELRYEGRECR
jgi:hypothetical protein